MYSKTLAYLITPSFLPQLLVSIESARKDQGYSEDINILFFAATLPDKSTQALFGRRVYWHLAGEPQEIKELYHKRPSFVLQLFDDGYEQVIHLGADVVFYSGARAELLEDSPFTNLVSCHSSAPVYPIATHKTGLVNSDYVSWAAETSRSFLAWQQEQLNKVNDNQNGYFFDQIYLDFVFPQLRASLGIVDPVTENRAWYNIHEPFDRAQLASFQFTGFREQVPTVLTKHKSIDPKLITKDVVELCLDYADRIASAKARLS
jgi:hypothetical protein